MNRFIPELQRLIRWAKAAPAPEPSTARPGFAARVSACWCQMPVPDLLLTWQRAVWASAWAAVAIIGLGLVLLSSQRLETNSGYDLSPAYQVVSTELVP
jgi:hypothetical protein